MEKHVGISLTRWTMIQYCSSIWKRPEFSDYVIQPSSRDNSCGIIILPTKLREHLDKLFLPLPIKNELIIAVAWQGTKIEDWFRELRRYIPDITITDFFNHIHWSYNATIDPTQSIKSLYKAELFPITFASWELLCLYCIEEYVLDFWTKISTNNEHKDVFQKITTHRHFSVLVRYWKFRVTHNLLELQESIHDYDYSRTLEENLLMDSRCTDEVPFRYLWNRLDESKKLSILRIIDTPGGKFYGLTLDNIVDFNLFMFILQQLINRGSEEMLNKMKILPSVIPQPHVWPHTHIFMSAMHDFYIHDYFERFYNMATLLTVMLCQRVYNADDSKTRQVFYDFWKVHQCGNLMTSIINCIIDHKDIESLRYAIRHANTRNKRAKIFKILDSWLLGDSSWLDYDWELIDVLKDMRNSLKKKKKICK